MQKIVVRRSYKRSSNLVSAEESIILAFAASCTKKVSQFQISHLLLVWIGLLTDVDFQMDQRGLGIGHL